MKPDQDPSGAELRVAKILTLFRELGRLDAELDLEYSFKAVRDHLLENRFLVGVDRQEARGNQDGAVVVICENIGMPPNLLAAFEQSIADANHVYFGAEKDQRTLLLKVYLEFRDKAEREMAGARLPGASYPLFTGFKWDAFSPSRQAVTRYTWYPAVSVAEIASQLHSIVDPCRHEFLLEIVREIIEQAATRIPPDDIQFLEVTEEGSSRKSFDINLYKAGMRLDELLPHLLAAVRHYAIPETKFASLYQAIHDQRLGHMAGGVDRNNNDFMTVYYGARRIQSAQFGSARVAPDRQAR